MLALITEKFDKLSLTQQQMVLFLFVGAMNTAFCYCIFALFIYLKFHYAIAAWISTCFGILFNFNTTGRIVFKSSRFTLIFKFIGVYVFLYCLNVSLIKMLQHFFTNNYLNGFIAIFPCAAVAFVLNKFIVFKDTMQNA